MDFPSRGTSWPVATSTTRARRPGTGIPCLARTRSCSSGGSCSRSGVSRDSDATGPVSVMPQPWIMATPTVCWNPSISDAGTAEPPAVMHRMEDTSRGSFRRCWSSPIHTVGTPARTVTRSVSMSSASDAGSALNCPANTCRAPAIVAAYGMPHALAWNMGTTGSTASWSVIPMAPA